MLLDILTLRRSIDFEVLRALRVSVVPLQRDIRDEAAVAGAAKHVERRFVDFEPCAMTPGGPLHTDMFLD